MQPDAETAKQARWGRRLLFAGLFSMLMASILLYSQIDVFDAGINPSKNNVGSVEGNRQIDLSLQDDCYIAFSLSSDIEGEVALQDSAGNNVEEEYCGGDFEPFAKEGQTFFRIGSWEISVAGNYSLTYSCGDTSIEDSTCENDEVWLISYEESFSSIINIGIILVCGTCIIGIVLIPLGTVLLSMRPKAPKQTYVIVETDTEGQAMVNVDGSPKYVAVQAGPGGENAGQQTLTQGSTAPDAANLLTTDQVYTMIHGNSDDKAEILNEVNERSSKALVEQLGEYHEGEIPDPFLDSQIDGRAHNVSIPIVKYSSPSSEKLPDDGAWKEWDEG